MSTDSSGIPAARRRDTVLAGIESFRALDSGLTVANIVVFLYVAENEGISVTELAAVSGLRKPTASRSIRSLATRGSRWALEPYLGLVEVGAQGPARNSKTIRLTDRGRKLREKLDALIVDPVTITERRSSDFGDGPAFVSDAGSSVAV